MSGVMDRFMAKVEPVTESGCWIWMACVHATGYGRFGMGSREVEYAHRAAWRLFQGPIPAGLYVCHKCDERLCANPDHLFLGTAEDNMRDASRKGRIRIPSENFASDESHQQAKLTNDQVHEIRASNDTLTALATRYGVCRRSIWSAKTGRTFKDVA